MELTKPTSAPTPASSTPAPAATPVAPPKTVNDVAAPQPAADSKPMDLSVHEPAAALDEPQDEQPAKKAPAPKAAKPKAAKPKTPGAGVAIFAAVVIILGLGAMMTYAYLRSQNISLF